MNLPKRIDITQKQLDDLLKRVESGSLKQGDYEIIKAMAETITFLSNSMDNKNASIKRLLKMIFGAETEKTAKVLKRGKSKRKSKGKEKKKAKRSLSGL